jgi:hypothetical protein
LWKTRRRGEIVGGPREITGGRVGRSRRWGG